MAISSAAMTEESAGGNLLKSRLEASQKVLLEKLGSLKPEIGIILGSGLGPLADHIQDALYIPFEEVPYMKTATASSHVGRFVCGTLSGKNVIAMQGRLHGYEGNEAWEVAYPVWLMHLLGVKILITTNAAGAINESMDTEGNVYDHYGIEITADGTSYNPDGVFYLE